jgi:mono/diheme cytochrome c family protein
LTLDSRATTNERVTPVRSRCAAAILALAILALAALAPAAEPPSKTPELVEQGRAAFAKYCYTCHGPNGEGDGPAASTLRPPPRNLVTHPVKGGAPEVFRVLSTGVNGTAMAPFTYLSETERWALSYYVAGLKDAKKR